MIEAGLVTLLASVAPAYPGHVPDDTALPAISYTRSSTSRFQHHDGGSGITGGTFAIVYHGDTHLAAMNGGRALVALLEDYAGTLGTTTVANTEILNDADLGDGGDGWLYLVEARFHYYEV